MAHSTRRVIPIGHIVNSLPLTPGGLGVGETAFNIVQLDGASRRSRGASVSRVWTIPVGLLGLAFYLRGVRRSVFDEESSNTFS